MQRWSIEFRQVKISNKRNDSANAYTLKELMHMNGDSFIEMLKADIEGKTLKKFFCIKILYLILKIIFRRRTRCYTRLNPIN